MLRYIFDRSEVIADFVVRSKIASGHAERVGYTGNYQAIGVVRDNELIAGLVYFNYNPEAQTIEMSAEATPGKRWLQPSTLAIMFQYPFLTCGCQMLITKTLARNEHILRMLAAMNFSLVRIPRSGGRDEDGIIALLTDDDWRESRFCRRYGHDVVPAQADAA